MCGKSVESAGYGHFPQTPAVEDFIRALSSELTAPDEASKAALRVWIQTVAEEAVHQIDSKKESVRRQEAAEAERARIAEAERQAAAERQAIMDRSEWERQDVLAKEAEAAKWAAYEAQQAQFEAYKARTAPPAEATA